VGSLVCPTAGNGVHFWLPSAARILSFEIDDPNTIAAKLAQLVKGCGRSVPAREIRDAVELVCSTPPEMATGYRHKATRAALPEVEPCPEMIARAAEGGPTLEELRELSSVTEATSESVLTHLFADDDLVCAAVGHPWRATTRPLCEWRGELRNTAQIVPSPMTARHGTNKAGKCSSRCLDNTGPRRWLVVESDIGTQDEQSAVLWHLGEYQPLALVVHSGGKSLHGWFPVRGNSEETVRKFHAYAIKLGADPSTLVRCQMVRTPGGLRDTGERQEVVFFNPEVAA